MQHVVLVSGGGGSWAHFCVHQSSWEFLSEASAPATWEAAQGHKTPSRLCADSGLCESLWELQPGPELSIWSPFPGRDANKRIFLHRYANSPKKRAPFSIASVLLLGFRWLKKPELCVCKAAGTGVVPKCLCLGICKAINVSFFLLQLPETPIFSIDFTQNAYCPWRCDLYLGLIYFCHGCSIF